MAQIHHLSSITWRLVRLSWLGTMRSVPSEQGQLGRLGCCSQPLGTVLGRGVLPGGVCKARCHEARVDTLDTP